MPFTAKQIADQIQGEVIGDENIQLSGLAPADSARAGDLTFAEKETYFTAAEQSEASAILVPQGFNSSKKVLIRGESAYRHGQIAPALFSSGSTTQWHSPNRGH